MHTHRHTLYVHYNFCMLLPLMTCTCNSLWRTSLGYWNHFVHMHRGPKVPTSLQSSPMKSLSHCLTGAEVWKFTLYLHPIVPLQNYAEAGTSKSHSVLILLSVLLSHAPSHFLTGKQFINQSLAYKSLPQVPLLRS